MKRLRNLSLCLTMTVWALLAPGTAGAAALGEPQHPAAWSWPNPVAALQDLVQEWLAAVFGSSEEAVVEESGDRLPLATTTSPDAETLSRIDGRGEAFPDFDPNG
jgi:hypothetical protein